MHQKNQLLTFNLRDLQKMMQSKIEKNQSINRSIDNFCFLKNFTNFFVTSSNDDGNFTVC